MIGQSLTSFNLAIAVSGLMLSVLGLMQAVFNRQPVNNTRKYFITFFLVLTVYVSCNLLGIIVYGFRGPAWAVCDRILLFGESLSASVLMLLLSGFLMYCSGEVKWKKTLTFKLSFFFWLVYFGMLVITQFTDVIYTIDDNNIYKRGSLYPLLLMPAICLMFINFIAYFRKRKVFTERQRLAFGVYVTVPLFAMIIQMLFYGLYMIVLGTTLSAFFMLTNLLFDQTERYFFQEAENEKLKTEVLMAQIKPHFIYNSLTTIRSYLDEPEKAEDVLNHFIGFLRGSVDVINNIDCIPAKNEFATVDNYLYMEKERFGSKLMVETELLDTDFLLPAFAVQTLVENAVNHGVRSREDGRGSVKIRSYKEGSNHVVEVSDDGVGFTEAGKKEKFEDRDHIGIRNLKSRLSLMCDGRLEIKSVPGDTRVRIIIPDVNWKEV